VPVSEAMWIWKALVEDDLCAFFVQKANIKKSIIDG
jgi:hypothetical protein